MIRVFETAPILVAVINQERSRDVVGQTSAMARQLAKHIGATVATTASAANADMLKGLGADIVIDYKRDDLSTKLNGYDLVIDTQGGDTLKKSLSVLKPGGKLIGIAGPPDPEFAKLRGTNGLVSLVMRLLSYGILKAATRSGTSYPFHFMTAKLIEAGHIQPVVDRVFPFEETEQALDYVETRRTKG